MGRVVRIFKSYFSLPVWVQIWGLSEAFRRLLEAISEAKNLQKPLKNQVFLYIFGKRNFQPGTAPKTTQNPPHPLTFVFLGLSEGELTG
ncbi:MAG: hypothetical protein AAGB03_09680, partial [Pseudomonadota bacterium]